MTLTMTFKLKGRGADKITWAETTVAVINHTCALPVTPCQNVCCLKGLLHLHMLQSENKSENKRSPFFFTSLRIHFGIKFRKGSFVV